MNEVQEAREQGRLEAKVDMLIQKVDQLDEVLNERIGKRDDEVDELREDMVSIKTGIKIIWGLIGILAILGSGVLYHLFVRG